MTDEITPPKNSPPSPFDRFIDSDGTSRIVRLGEKRAPWLGDHYHTILTISWPWFFFLMVMGYGLLNCGFALAYLACGDGIENARPGDFADAFFFSVQTMATIGYGQMAPRGIGPNILVVVEALVGILGLTLGSGLMYARFTRPTAGVMFTRRAVISPFNAVPTLMVRIANQRANYIVEANVHLVLVRNEVTEEGERYRRFHDLKLERHYSPVFSMSWTVMHPIDFDSPFFGQSPQMLIESQCELLVMFSGWHEAFGQLVHARHAYAAYEIDVDSRFADMFKRLPDGQRAIDFSKFDVIEKSESQR